MATLPTLDQPGELAVVVAIGVVVGHFRARILTANILTLAALYGLSKLGIDSLPGNTSLVLLGAMLWLGIGLVELALVIVIGREAASQALGQVVGMILLFAVLWPFRLMLMAPRTLLKRFT